MTRARLLILAERRALLVARAHAERERLDAYVARTDGISTVFEAGRRLLQELGRQPLIVIGGAALLIALRPRRALKWLMQGWSLWRMYRGAQRWWQGFAAGAAQNRQGQAQP